MRLRWLGIFLLIATSTFAQSGVGGGGQSNVGGGGSASPGSPGTVGGGASPIMAVYLSPQCPVANTGNCFNTFADTQQSQACSWTAATPSTVTCGSQITLINAAIGTNVATYRTNTIWQNSTIPPTWVNGNSITVTGFSGGDTFFNQTCTLTAVTTNSVSCALVHADTTSSTQGIMTNTSVGPFVAGDVGKQVAGWQSCRAFDGNTVMGTNAISTAGAPLVTSFISQTQVQITTAANAQAAQLGCFIWGHPDDTAAATAEAAYVNYPFCPRLELAASNYMFTKPHFYTNPLACAAEGTSYPSNAGNIFYSAGFELEGRGTGNTVIYLMPNFPNGDSCNRGENGYSCFVIPQLGRWKDFQITGGSQSGSNISGSPKALVSGTITTVNNVTCTNYGAYLVGGNTLYGFQASYQDQFDQYNNSGCGNVGLDIMNARGVVTARWLAIENNITANVSVDGPGIGGNLSAGFTCYDCHFFGSESTTLTSVTSWDVINFGGWVNLYRTTLGSGGGGGAGTTVTGYQGASSGSILIARDSIFSMTSGPTSTSILCSAACTNYLSTTKLTAFGTGKTYSDFAGSILYDQGGNTLGVASATLLGSVFGSGSITGAALVNGGVVLSTCGTSAVSAASGSSAAGQFTITFAGTPGTACTWTLTYPVSFLAAPLCTFADVGGTNVFPTSIVNGTVNTTTAAATETATAFTNGNTEIVQYRCQNP